MEEIQSNELPSQLTQAEIAFENHLRQGATLDGLEIAWKGVVQAAHAEAGQGADGVAILERLIGLAAFTAETTTAGQYTAIAQLFAGRARAFSEAAEIVFTAHSQEAATIPRD